MGDDVGDEILDRHVFHRAEDTSGSAAVTDSYSSAVPAVVPHADAPAVSVLIVVYGGGALVIDAVESLVEHTKQPFEVIVVDNNSRDDSVARIRDGVSGLTLIEESTNLGFGGGCNRAAQAARAPMICMLNPDARVTAGWLEPLLALATDPRVGAVAPALLRGDGTLQEAGAMVDHWGYTGPVGTRGFGEEVPMPSTRVVVDYASAACLLMRTNVFRDLHGFDPAYRLAYYEDVDLCFRLWERQLQVWAEPASQVVHLGGGTVTPVVSQALWHHNRSVFLHRWRDVLAGRPSFHSATDDELQQLWSVRRSTPSSA